MGKHISIVGPMRAGKTWELAKRINENSTAIGVETVYNTRGTERELSKIAPCVTGWTPGTELPYKIDGQRITAYCFDEVHFFEVFRDLEKFLDVVDKLKVDYDLVFSGLFTDCYSMYRPFKIWSYLFPMSSIIFLPSREKCARCGAEPKEASLSVPVDPAPANCVGDHYENVCRACRDNKRGV